MKVNCPNCAKEVEWSAASEYRPFCCKKCQLIDLGEWAEEQNTISTPMGQSQQINIDPEDIEAMLIAQSKSN